MPDMTLGLYLYLHDRAKEPYVPDTSSKGLFQDYLSG
jgi:hypothetical protein